jgi:hypothetical protein
MMQSATGRWPDAEARHARERLERACGGAIPFRLAEAPLLLDAALVAEMVAASHELAAQLEDDAYLRQVAALLPPGAPDVRAGRAPAFVQFDYALVRGPDGPRPRLTELQGFPSLYAFQHVLGSLYQEEMPLPAGARLHLGGLDGAGFLALFRASVCGRHDPAEVALVDARPWEQGTWPDFALTRQLVPGLAVVDASDLRRRGRAVFRVTSGVEVPVRRIYNRLLWEDVGALPFGIDEVDVEWAGHPACFLTWSKLSLPFVRHEVVPEARLLAPPWPDDLGAWVLKPLFGASGRGVRLDVDRALLDAIPARERAGWLLQRRFEFADVLTGPEGGIRAEVRVMCLRADGALRPVMMLPRLSRGRLMGCGFNTTDPGTGHGVAFEVGRAPNA